MSYESERAEEDRLMVRLAVKVLLGVVVAIFVIVFGWLMVKPQINLYRANTEKKALIAEAKAQNEAAKYRAEAEITRANGVAEANKVVASSITPEYTQWLYVDQLDTIAAASGATVIYVPTEGGLPVLEAGRATGTNNKE